MFNFFKKKPTTSLQEISDKWIQFDDVTATPTRGSKILVAVPKEGTVEYSHEGVHDINITYDDGTTQQFTDADTSKGILMKIKSLGVHYRGGRKNRKTKNRKNKNKKTQKNK
jgi:hypothetical protein